MNLIAIGDNVVDCYLDQNKYYPGGNCVNVAVNAKKNGAENVAYMGVFATDQKAEHIKHALNQESIDFEYSRTAEGISGQPQVSLTTEGDRVFIGGPKNTIQHVLKLQLTEKDLEYISQYDLCHVSCYSSMEGELAKLSKVIDISYDFSNKLDLDYVELVAKHIKHAFFSAAELNDHELKAFIDKISEFDFEVVALTRGGLPALFIKDNHIYEQTLNPIKVIDTMGAGDSLIAGFLVNYISGADMNVSIERATKSAENTCKMYGGFGYPKEF